MPKLGRRDGSRGPNHESQLAYLFPADTEETSSRPLAPFGTDNTPQMRVRLVGGVPQMIVEDHKFKEAARELPPTPVRLAPKVTSNRSFNPDKINTYPMSMYGYKDPEYPAAGSQDSHRSRIEYSRDLNPDPRRGKSQFSPHRVLPPVGGPRGYEALPYSTDPTSQLEQKLPLTTYLPIRPITFRKVELLELKKRVIDEMRDFDLNKLKDLYTTLTGFDRHLLGFVIFEELNESLIKYRTDLSTNTVRLIASQYINSETPIKVNYEKVLSFISGALKEANSIRPVEKNPARPIGGGGGHYPPLDNNVNVSSPKDSIYYNPLTHTVDDYSQSSLKYPGGNKDNAKLLRLVEQQLVDCAADDNDLDLQSVWRTFSQADRMRRNMMSREQIKSLSNACKIPLQDTLVNQIIDRCDESNGQHNWQQYLEFIERVAPLKTGLKIPESKKPSEYAVQMPQPSSNWPNLAAPHERETYGGPVPDAVKGPSNYYDKLYNNFNSPSKASIDPYGPRESRQSNVHALEDKIRDLEVQYTRDKDRLFDEKKVAIKDQESWFDRYYRLANALYAQDAHNTGHLKAVEARWLINQYNLEYNLGISELNVENTLASCSDGDDVILSALLKSLMMYEV